MLAPVLPFLISLIVFKIVGFVVQQKVNHFYKYKAGDLRLGLWNQLNPRLGLCVGLANATIYMVLISLVVYVASYPTVQLAGGNGDHWSVRLLNQAGWDLEKLGLTKVAAAVDPIPASYFDAADLAGLIYHNDLLEARLGRYPAFISLGEEQVFKQIAASKDFRELRQRQPPVMDIVNNPLLQPIVGDPNMLNRIWDLLTPNFQDLQEFLQTGLSEKYADKHLVGRWDANFPASFSELQETLPTATSTEMRNGRRDMALILTNTTTLVATLDDRKIYLKNIGTITYVTNIVEVTPAQPQRGNGRATGPAQGRPGTGAFNETVNPQQVFGYGGGRGGGGAAAAVVMVMAGCAGWPGSDSDSGSPAAPVRRVVVTYNVKMDNLQGTWSGQGDNFQIQLPNRRLLAKVDGDTLTIVGLKYPIVFDRE